MAATAAREVTFPSDGGRERLRGRLRLPPAGSAARGTAVLCHPHPAFGGNMDVWLLPTLSEALAEDGWRVLRFDFRSAHTDAAGVADGRDDGHARERTDLRAALAFLRDEGLLDAGGRLALIGWSFGALIALLHGLEDPAVTDWVGIAPAAGPLPRLPMRAVPTDRVTGWPARRVVIAGRHDQFFPPGAMDALHPDELHVLEDCDHFFFDHDHEVARLTVTALARGAGR